MSNKDSIDDIYQYIVAQPEKSEKKKKESIRSYDSEIEHFKAVLRCDTRPARSIVKIKPILSKDWIKLI